MKEKYHSAEHYAAILRNRAVIERTVKGDEGYNGLAANFDAAADMLDIQAGKIVANEVLLKHYKKQLGSYMDAYSNMRDFAIESGLDVTTYSSHYRE